MKNLKNDLQAVNKELKALVKKTDSLMKALARIEKAQSPKAKSVKKPVTKKTTPVKKTAKLTATDTIIRIIKRSRKGVDVPTLMDKTGFNERKVRNIIFRINKLGRIKRIRKGIYVVP
jgi:DNA-binding transcriptional regulator PaaX